MNCKSVTSYAQLQAVFIIFVKGVDSVKSCWTFLVDFYTYIAFCKVDQSANGRPSRLDRLRHLSSLSSPRSTKVDCS